MVPALRETGSQGTCWSRRHLGRVPVREGAAVRRPAAFVKHVDFDEDESYTVSLPDDLYLFLLGIEVDPRHLDYLGCIEGKTVLESFEKRAPTTPEELASAVKEGLGASVSFLAIPRDDPDVVRIKAAIEWWIDLIRAKRN